MKYIMMLIMCIPALVLLNGVSGEFNNGSIVIEFPNSLNPTVEDGVVITGYAYLLMAQNSDKSSFVGELKLVEASLCLGLPE